MKNLYIPIIYKDYGRNRGNDTFAKNTFKLLNKLLSYNTEKEFFNNFKINEKKYLESFKKLMDNFPLAGIKNYKDSILEFYELKSILLKEGINLIPELCNIDNLSLKDKKNILFSICCIQEESTRKFNLNYLNSKRDIIFYKGYKDSMGNFLPTFRSSEYFKKEFFPTYYIEYARHTQYSLDKFPKKYEHFKKKEEPKIKIILGIYNRKDSCPIQYAKLLKFYNDLNCMIEFKDFEFDLFEFGFGNNLSQKELIKMYNKIDILLYTEPDHQDIFPYTVYEAINQNCLILHIDEEFEDYKLKYEENGIKEIQQLFPNNFIKTNDLIDFIDFDFDKFKLKIWKSYENNKTVFKSLNILTASYIMNKIITEYKKEKE